MCVIPKYIILDNIFGEGFAIIGPYSDEYNQSSGCDSVTWIFHYESLRTNSQSMQRWRKIWIDISMKRLSQQAQKSHHVSVQIMHVGFYI